MIRYSELLCLAAVWKAVEGDRSQLIGLLRSDMELGRLARHQLAEWLDGKLLPMKLPKGHPPKVSPALVLEYQLGMAPDFWGGHEPETALGLAGMEFDSHWGFIRKKGWNRKKAGRLCWSRQRLLAQVAARNGIDLNRFANYMNRSRPIRRVMTDIEFLEALRREIAYEIHHTKIGQKA